MVRTFKARAMFWDRRQSDRRKYEGPRDDEPERRGTRDRRRWTCGILYRTSLPASEVEAWLGRNTSGRWAVALEGIDEGLSTKVLKIMFEDASDKARFMAAFAGR